MSWPFENWLRLAVLRFGLNPEAFWAMSMKDWRALTQSDAVNSLPRDVFDTLRKDYPDGETHET